MKAIIKKTVYVFAALFFSLLVCFQSIPIKVFAEISMTYDSSAIEDDLQDVDITKYPKNESGKPTFVRFMEYCYSTRPFLAETYGLYLYVYNPTEQEVNTSGNNVANMAVAYDSDGEPSAYTNVALTFLDCTDNYRFYKFKVKDSAAYLTLAQEYANTHDGKRRYDVAGVQLWYADGTIVVDGSVEKTYFFEGFAQGCGADDKAESTLTCNSETLETLPLDVHATHYRPEGTNGKNEYTQDSLHSVYFAVPNKYIEKYGEMVAVHATWLNAVLKPVLVTGNQEAYAAIKEYLGVTLPSYEGVSYGAGTLKYHTDDLPYVYYGAHKDDVASKFTYGFGYNVVQINGSYEFIQDSYGYDMDSLYMLFNSGDEIDSADSYTVTSKALQAEMLASAEKYGGDLIQGASGVYSSAIFESVDNEYIDKTIWRDEESKLTSEVIGPSWWDKLWGITTTSTFDGIKAIYAVQESDITYDSAIDCANLYISEADYTDFVDFYDDNQDDSTVYLFRYQISDYVAQEATLYEPTTTSNVPWKKIDTNAYFFQETVNLNFEVIDVTFEANGVETIIPVVMTPIDIVHSGTPPVNTTSDKEEDPYAWLRTLLAIVVLLLLYYILRPIITPIINLVLDIITLPFVWIGNLFKGNKKK